MFTMPDSRHENASTHSPPWRVPEHPSLLSGIILLGAALRLGAIGAESIWLDEAFSIWMAGHPLPELLNWLVRIDQHPPLYYVLLRGWMHLFGDGQTAVRLLSALCSTLALPFFYCAVRRLFDARTGGVATLLLALSPLQVHYAQEARMYALLTLEVAVLLCCLSHILTARAAARGSVVAWLGLSAAQAAIMLTHNAAAVYVPLALQVAVLGPLLWRAPSLPGPKRPRFVRHWALAQAGTLLLWLPWARAFAVQAAGVDRSFWMGPPSFGSVVSLLQALQLAHLPDTFPLFTAWHLLFWGCVAAGAMSLRRKPAHLWLLLALLAVPVAVSLLASLRRPVFSTHTLLWLSLPWLTLMALGVRAIRKRWSRMGSIPLELALALLMAVPQTGALHGYYAYFHKEAWDEAAQTVAAAAQPGDLILFNATWVQLPFEYYFRDYEIDAELRGLPVDLFGRGVLEPAMAEADLPRLRALLAEAQAGEQVWLIYSHNWYTDPQGLIPAELARHLGPGEEQAFRGVRVLRFQK